MSKEENRFLKFLKKKNIEFDAILCADDSLASGALKYAKIYMLFFTTIKAM